MMLRSYPELGRLMGNPKKIALLITDEEHAAPEETSNTSGKLISKPGKDIPQSSVTPRQQRLLLYMQAVNCPVWSISYPCGRGALSDIDLALTRTSLKAFYNGRQHILQKGFTNSFLETTLHMDLKRHGITHLVVMGWDSNVCVPDTINMSEEPNNVWHDGATRLGYKVLTCDQILHGYSAEWPYDILGHYRHLCFFTEF